MSDDFDSGDSDDARDSETEYGEDGLDEED